MIPNAENSMPSDSTPDYFYEGAAEVFDGKGKNARRIGYAFIEQMGYN